MLQRSLSRCRPCRRPSVDHCTEEESNSTSEHASGQRLHALSSSTGLHDLQASQLLVEPGLWQLVEHVVGETVTARSDRGWPHLIQDPRQKIYVTFEGSRGIVPLGQRFGELGLVCTHVLGDPGDVCDTNA